MMATAPKRALRIRSGACKDAAIPRRLDVRWVAMTATVLLVEDEPSIGMLVRRYLERDGFRVIWVRAGEDALVELERHAISLMVLDIGLPGMDGFAVSRRAGGRVPTIMLTARDEEADRVAGLEGGADDYVTKPFSPRAKPFSPRELTARVKAVLRRNEATLPADDEVSLGPLIVSRGRREVWIDGREIELTQREFDLLLHLLERRGAVVSRDELLERVWGFLSPGETRTVEVHVAQLRKKLGRPELIRTVRGIGYKAAG